MALDKRGEQPAEVKLFSSESKLLASVPRLALPKPLPPYLEYEGKIFYLVLGTKDYTEVVPHVYDAKQLTLPFAEQETQPVTVEPVSEAPALDTPSGEVSQ